MVSNLEIWQRFRAVTTLHFNSKSHTGIGWEGVGSGIVTVDEPASNVLIFNERGSWQQEGGKEIRFSNVFRWSLLKNRLRLEHLQFGADKPVFLFEMESGPDGIWHEVDPHPCRDDCYRASMRFEDEQIFVSWLVRGPKRNEIIDYVYL